VASSATLDQAHTAWQQCQVPSCWPAFNLTQAGRVNPPPFQGAKHRRPAFNLTQGGLSPPFQGAKHLQKGPEPTAAGLQHVYSGTFFYPFHMAPSTAPQLAFNTLTQGPSVTPFRMAPSTAGLRSTSSRPSTLTPQHTYSGPLSDPFLWSPALLSIKHIA
jgi:hypothetical protein